MSLAAQKEENLSSKSMNSAKFQNLKICLLLSFLQA
jgi:hypothetical protein